MRLKPIVIAIAVLLVAVGCEDYDRPPDTPSFLGLPESTAISSTTVAKVFSSAPTGKFLTYLIDWGEGTIETSATYVAGDTAEQWHTWHSAGMFSYRAMAFYTFDTTKMSEWSATRQIAVHP